MLIGDLLRKFRRKILPPSSGYFKNPDDEAHKFLQNVGNKLQTRRHIPEDYYPRQQRYGNLELRNED